MLEKRWGAKQTEVLWVYLNTTGHTRFDKSPEGFTSLQVSSAEGSPFPPGTHFYGLRRGNPYPLGLSQYSTRRSLLTIEQVDIVLDGLEAFLAPDFAAIVRSSKVVLVCCQASRIIPPLSLENCVR